MFESKYGTTPMRRVEYLMKGKGNQLPTSLSLGKCEIDAKWLADWQASELASRANGSIMHMLLQRISRPSFVKHLRADQQLSPSRLPINAIQRKQLQALRPAIESEARPRDHAIFLESIILHNLEPRRIAKVTRQLSVPMVSGMCA